MSKAYFIDCDNSGHWYLVEADFRREWEAWQNLDEDDVASWQEPAFAERLDGPINRVEFESPVEI